MRKILLLSFLSCFVFSAAQAQSRNVRILFTFDVDASLEVSARGYAANADFAAAQVARINLVLANSGVAWRVESAGSLPFSCCIGATSVGGGLAGQLSYDMSYAALRDNYTADVTMAFTEMPGDPINGSGTLGPGIAAVSVVNVSKAADGYTAVHEFGHNVGAHHQRGNNSPGNPDASNAHGFVWRTGTSASSCQVTYTVMASDVDPSIATICMGFNEYFDGRNGQHVCSAQQWCSDYVLWNAPQYPPATTATSWGTASQTGNPYSMYTCQAFDSHFSAASSPPYVRSGGTEMGNPTSGPGTVFVCPNLVQVPYFSSPNLVYQGVTMGAANADNAALMSANGAFMATLRDTSMVLYLSGLQFAPILDSVLAP